MTSSPVDSSALTVTLLLLSASCAPDVSAPGGPLRPGSDDAGADSGLGGGDGDADASPPGSTDDGAGPTEDGAPSEAGPSPDAFFAEDPPPRYCGPEDRPPPEPPGGTPECPDDKNREGCPCDRAGESAPCWPGLRVDRGRGICRDGVTECVPVDEFGSGRWGPCEGYVLPVVGATRGPAACDCFSAGRWEIDNLSPCFVSRSTGEVCAVSTFLDESGEARCPGGSSWPPEPDLGFSPSRLLVDCSGEFRLCLTLRAGDAEAPLTTDCVLAETCAEAWYDAPEEGETAMAELPELGPWQSCDETCVRRFMDEGGYAEMSVVGLSIECEEIGTEASPLVFNVVTYCPLYCEEPESAGLPECEGCGNGASGSF